MPSRQINEFLQKGNRKKIELVARPGMQDRATRALLDPVTVPKPGHLRLRDAQGLANQAHTVPRLLAVAGALAESLLGQHWGHQVGNSVGIAADARVL